MTATPVDTPTVNASGRLRGLWSFQGKHRVLHLTWFAFFLSFVVWFNYAPFANTIAEQLGLTAAQKKTIGLCNVALTVPARIFIGMALDRWGPRRVYSVILMFAVVPNTIFALSSTFTTLVFSRLALSVVGAGFVVGIRMVSEWFPPSEVGTAEGVYGGWGNFGSAAAAFSLPVLATTNAARMATSVLPKPTSPQTTRSMGCGLCKSSKTAVIAASWSGVSSNGKLLQKLAYSFSSI